MWRCYWQFPLHGGSIGWCVCGFEGCGGVDGWVACVLGAGGGYSGSDIYKSHYNNQTEDRY